MAYGRIQKIYRDKGFGFVSYGDQNAFFHASECVNEFDDLALDQRVSFELETHERGLRACQVVVIDDEPTTTDCSRRSRPRRRTLKDMKER